MPLDNDQVAMVAEWVDIEIRGDESWVTCVFTFTNAGPAAEVLMGFPQDRGLGDGRPEAPEVQDFRVFVDSVEVPVTFHPQEPGEGEEDYAGWHIFEVPFEAGQTRIVRDTYHGRLAWGGYRRYLGYTLHTGASWAGPIGRADIVVRWGVHEVNEIVSVRPSGFVSGERELRWRFSDLEPTHEHDIGVDFYPVQGPDMVGIAAASSGQLQRDPWGTLPSHLFADGDGATAWQTVDETSGAWLIWSYYAGHQCAPITLGLGLLPGVPGGDFRGHGRSKEVLIRLARLKERIDEPPAVDADPQAFLQPDPGIEITEHRLLLEDTPQWQFLVLEQPAKVLAFQVVVESAYPGERYDDVAIAEVLFPLFEEHLAALPGQPETGEAGLSEQDLAAPPGQPGAGGAGLPWGQLVALALGVGAMVLGGVLSLLKRRWHER